MKLPKLQATGTCVSLQAMCMVTMQQARATAGNVGGDSLRDLSEQHDPPQLARRYTVLPCSLLQYAAHLPGSLPQKLLC